MPKAITLRLYRTAGVPFVAILLAVGLLVNSPTAQAADSLFFLPGSAGSQFKEEVQDTVFFGNSSFGLSAVGLLMALIVFYLFLGMFMDVLSMQVLTIPVALPIVVAVGVDPIWFGIFMVIMVECALITPPVGLNLYVIQSVAGAPLGEVAKGVLPFLALMILTVFVMYVLPDLALYIPFKL